MPRAFVYEVLVSRITRDDNRCDVWEVRHSTDLGICDSFDAAERLIAEQREYLLRGGYRDITVRKIELNVRNGELAANKRGGQRWYRYSNDERQFIRSSEPPRRTLRSARPAGPERVAAAPTARAHATAHQPPPPPTRDRRG